MWGHPSQTSKNNHAITEKENEMKNFTQRIKETARWLTKPMLACLAIAGMLAVLVPMAHAEGYLQAFQTTNFLGNSTTVNTNITSWPTNSPGTNGLGVLTGKGVAVGNQERYEIVFQGYLTNAAAAIVGFQYVTAVAQTYGGGGPTIGYGNTNLYPGTTTNVFTQNDWSYYPSAMINIAIPALTNWFNWQTNVSVDTLGGDGGWIGIYTITNNIGSGSWITNANGSSGLFYVYKKLIPKPLGPGE